MSELYQFISKITSSLPFITERKLYSRVSFYYKETPLLLVDNESVVLHIEKLDLVPTLKQALTPWTLDGRTMAHWYQLPQSYNKKKNKLQPAIEQALSTWDKSKKTIAQANNKTKKKAVAATPTPQKAKQPTNEQKPEMKPWWRRWFNL